MDIINQGTTEACGSVCLHVFYNQDKEATFAQAGEKKEIRNCVANSCLIFTKLSSKWSLEM